MRFAEQKTTYRFTTDEDVLHTNLPAAGTDDHLGADAETQTDSMPAAVPSPASAGAPDGRRLALSRKTALIWVAATAGCVLLLWGSSVCAQLGYDWGYSAIKGLIGQPGDDQGEGAFLLYYTVIPTLTAGLFAGYMQGLFGGRWRWRAAVMAAFAGVGVLFFHSAPTLHELLEFSFYWTAMTTLAVGISIPVARLSAELKKRTRAVRLQACLLPAIVPWWLLFVETDTLLVQFLLYCSLMFGVGLLAPLATRSRYKDGIVSSVFFATLPVTIFNLANILFTLFSMVAVHFGFLNIGWHATLSALLIAVVAMAASALGGACGGTIVRLGSRSRLT